jgi:glutamate-5-semialdehyde dehydrogenase
MTGQLGVEALTEAARRARKASRALALASRRQKDEALAAIAARLRDDNPDGPRAAVLAANALDVAAAERAKTSDALIDRLRLDAARLAQLADAVDAIASFDDPIGEVVGMKRRPSGVTVGQVRIPLGVIAMIYEARPNVTVDAAALCIKSGNAVMLRGGKEAAHSNAALGALVRDAVASAGLPAEAVQVLPAGSREDSRALVGLAGLIDLVIPRGGEGLIRFVTEHARVPVIQHYKGVCHLYVDEGADVEMALALVENGKLQRPGVCNALECVLVHEGVAAALLPRVAALHGLELRGDPATVALCPTARAATDDDYGAEFLAPILASRVVASIDEALAHIERYGSNHTEAICTPSYANGQRFLRAVDASCVLVNASTRFNDGGELGLGAEIGISTTKLHAYGPMGLASLTALKWVAYGDGQTR